MLKCFDWMEAVYIFLNITTFGFWGSPKYKTNRENGMSFVVAVLSNIKWPKGIFSETYKNI